MPNTRGFRRAYGFRESQALGKRMAGSCQGVSPLSPGIDKGMAGRENTGGPAERGSRRRRQIEDAAFRRLAQDLEMPGAPLIGAHLRRQ
jgi:hypothetical protein